MGIFVFSVERAPTKQILAMTHVTYVHNILIPLQVVFYSLIVAAMLVIRGQTDKNALFARQIRMSSVMSVSIVQAMPTRRLQVLVSLIALAMWDILARTEQTVLYAQLIHMN